MRSAFESPMIGDPNTQAQWEHLFPAPIPCLKFCGFAEALGIWVSSTVQLSQSPNRPIPSTLKPTYDISWFEGTWNWTVWRLGKAEQGGFLEMLFPELCDNSCLRWGPPYNSFILGSSLHMCKILMRSSLCVVFSLARTFFASLGRTAAAAAMHCCCHP